MDKSGRGIGSCFFCVLDLLAQIGGGSQVLVVGHSTGSIDYTQAEQLLLQLGWVDLWELHQRSLLGGDPGAETVNL